MASFQAKIVWKSPRKRKNKNYCFVPILSGAEQKMPKKQKNNSKKLKNTITASFQAKIGWKMLRKIENKNYRYISFLPDGQEKFQKNSKKVQKIEKYHYDFIPSQNMLEKAENERK